MTTRKIRDVSLYVEVVGQGPPLLLMHGGPGLDHVSLTPFRRLADRHHGRLLRPPLQWPLDRCTGDVDDLGEPLRGRRRAPG